MHEPVKQGRLIVLEGPDGVGKTTLARALAGRLRSMGIACDQLSFPGREEGSIGSLVYRAHHETVAHGPDAISGVGLQALHVAAHLDEIERRILPALGGGRWVILDRFWWSTWVYGRQGAADCETLEALIGAELVRWRDIRPDGLFLIDRSNDEVDPDARAQLREGYRMLSDRERGKYPIHHMQNHGKAEDSIEQMIAILGSILPAVSREGLDEVDSPVQGRGGQLPLMPSQPRMPPLSPARPTVVYETLWRFAAERQEMFFRRIEGLLAPWTDDQILARHKFTNAYRASDRVSQYLIRNVIYEGDQSPEEVFFRTILFKLFNRIETWELLQRRLGFISWVDYSFQRYDMVLSEAMAAGTPIYSAAYMMASGRKSYGHGRKHRNHLMLLGRMMEDGVPQKLAEASSMAQAFGVLRSYPTIGDFLAYQFVTDLNYSNLTDFSEMEFVMPGPGALDGIRKCFSDLGGLGNADVIRLLTERQEGEFERLGLSFRTLWGRRLQLIDCQNLLCEVSKYARARHPEIRGAGRRRRIKQLYRQSSTPIEYWYPPKWGINDKLPCRGASA